MIVRFSLNGAPVEVDVRADDTLLAVLRRTQGLTSVRESCGIGVCGACTALLDGEVVSTCLVLAPAVDGRTVTTAEGIAADHPVKVAFAEAHAYQCGYCVPGLVLATTRLLEERPRPSDDEIVAALAGNLCRCGSYVKILDAVRRAAAAGG
ncbi:MAG: (2Fe-2S)-binding protein [Thermoleophilia bacterium]